MTRYFYVLPPELSDLKGNSEIEKIINNAWFHRESGNADTDVTGDFYVTLDGCLCHFSIDPKRTGRFNGGCLVTVSGVVLECSPAVQERWQKRLKTLESEMNMEILQGREKLSLGGRKI